jgi:PEP-CTERM motif
MKKIVTLSLASALLAMAFFASTHSAHAQVVTSLSPFTGTVQEDFEGFPDYITSVTPLSDPISILSGNASLTGTNNYGYESPAGAAIWTLGNNNTAQVFDGTKGLGMNDSGFSDDAGIIFATTATQFGAYFANADGGAVSGMTINFFDIADVAFYTETWNDVTGNGSLTWHGWASTTPIKRIEIRGESPVADSMRATLGVSGSGVSAPEPASLSLLALGGVGMLTKRRRK